MSFPQRHHSDAFLIFHDTEPRVRARFGMRKARGNNTKPTFSSLELAFANKLCISEEATVVIHPDDSVPMPPPSNTYELQGECIQ